MQAGLLVTLLPRVIVFKDVGYLTENKGGFGVFSFVGELVGLGGAELDQLIEPIFVVDVLRTGTGQDGLQNRGQGVLFFFIGEFIGLGGRKPDQLVEPIFAAKLLRATTGQDRL
ncbi:hypothetical protein ES705_48402 [subsurface metagenome]